MAWENTLFVIPFAVILPQPCFFVLSETSKMARLTHRNQAGNTKTIPEKDRYANGKSSLYERKRNHARHAIRTRAGNGCERPDPA